MGIDNHVAEEINTPGFIYRIRKQLNKPNLSECVVLAHHAPSVRAPGELRFFSNPFKITLSGLQNPFAPSSFTRRLRRRGACLRCLVREMLLLVLLGLILLVVVFDALRDALRVRESLEGELVLITGAAGGLGRELAREFAAAGAALLLWDVRANALDETSAWLRVEHRVTRLHAQLVDVSDAAAVSAALAEATALLGSVSVLVNNAAVVPGRSVLGGSAACVQRSFGVNSLAHWHCARAALPAMVHARRGWVVTIGSVMAAIPAAEACVAAERESRHVGASWKRIPLVAGRAVLPGASRQCNTLATSLSHRRYGHTSRARSALPVQALGGSAPVTSGVP